MPRRWFVRLQIFSVTGLFLCGPRSPVLYRDLLDWEGRGRMSCDSEGDMHRHGKSKVLTRQITRQKPVGVFARLLSRSLEKLTGRTQMTPLESDASGDLSGPHLIAKSPSLSPRATAQPPPISALPTSRPSEKAEVCSRCISPSLTSPSTKGAGEESAETKRKKKRGILLFPRESLLQLAGSFISPGFPNMPLIFNALPFC